MLLQVLSISAAELTVALDLGRGTNGCATSRCEIGHKMLNQIVGLLLFLGLILFT